MKRILTIAGALTLMASVSFGQLLDEKNVTITMDLQPVLQLKMEGPDQIDFTFDEISEYYSGITKYGANVLKVSSSVSFDLWAVGLSNNADFLWDQVMSYQGGGAGVSTISTGSLELHQFPRNPAILGACDPSAGVGVGPAYTFDNDYSNAFSPYVPATNTIVGGSNHINMVSNAAPYTVPLDAAVTAQDKFIAGGSGTGAGCQQVGGSYLTESLAALVEPLGVPVGDGYYFVMDYRLLPGLPVVFPAHVPANNTNLLNAGLVAADLLDGGLGTTAGVYAASGVYTMYIKYILVEDQ